MSKLSKIKKLAIASADEKYYSDREAAYAKKAQKFAELGKIKDAALAVAKSSKEIVTVRITYQTAYTAASNLWKKELADASSNRVLAKELAEKQYLDALEVAGVSIYPVLAKAVVAPVPEPVPTPTPTPSPSVINVQPTAAMKKVGTFYMASGSYFLNDASKISLKALALKINATEVKQVLVYGHTDIRGGVNNTWLSQQRAKAVASYLRPLLRGKKLVIGWYASSKPIATGTTASDLAKNRRVEIYTK
jgi:outer membrane protein OmpA-like peptidoglycan-associated protein